MLDLFTIFSKGGIVLWCFQGTSQLFTPSVNTLIKNVILQERGGNNSFTHDALTLKFKLDNEFELVFVVAYQKILQLSYVDKFLNDIQMEFRNKYKDDLQSGKLSRNFNFDDTFLRLLAEAENTHKQEAKAPKKMKTFDESLKSKKTVSSMIENKKEKDTTTQSKSSKKKAAKQAAKENEPVSTPKSAPVVTPKSSPMASNGEIDEETLRLNREKFFNRANRKTTPKEKTKSPRPEPVKKGKEKRQWIDGGSNKDKKDLDFSRDKEPEENGDMTSAHHLVKEEDYSAVGQLKGNLQDLIPDTDSSEEEDEEDTTQTSQPAQKSGGFGILSGLRKLVGSKPLEKNDIKPVLNKMRDHLIGKNVAADIAEKLCESVSNKLEGKVLGTFSSISATVKQTFQESLVQILSPKRRIDILRDVLDCKQQNRPYVITFCGVNGVGKSTNLAKICFWLVENGYRVLIAACDTFRAGAVEQLRTHTRKLNTLHPPENHGGLQMVQLYEKGYGKDAAGIAMEAINHARDRRIDVVLVDTAGRMQDNEPLMRALAKLIKVNQPDLVLFVGEALVGNDAIDQLTKFNQALADHSSKDNPQLIDGIVLSKFDTIDDKVGAAISMTYTTGQPIVFVGTGQTYTDLKNLNARAVVHALLKN